MNHLESSFTGKNAFWRYFIMLLAIFTATNTIGSVPLLIALGIKISDDPEIIDRLSANSSDLSPLGLNDNIDLLILIFPFIIGLIAFVLLIKPLNERSLGFTINGTGTFRWNRFIIAALVWLILSTIYLFGSRQIDPSNFVLNNTSGTLIPLITISVLFIPFQASFEEILFRGYLMQGFTVLLRNRMFPLVITSVLFGLMHSWNPEVEAFGFWKMMSQYILFGLIFGIITILDDGAEAAMGAHYANNAFLLVMNTTENSALQSDAVFRQLNVYPWIELASLFMIGLVAILIFKVVFRWRNFSVLLANVEPGNQRVQVS